MTAIGRLHALRLQGFKSFAERTLIEFGPGISAVVGPNGSGKSNLADALRWALGEQGRSLRIRRSEDVIFAGSERRSALGMADVALVIDNADGLLPVEYAAVELGRRLYRSGENDYLLNRQRVRLRDLVDLLDAANLADNAFLFIGQGMVDQALALRPEERRPLFEEVAGVRRHERRRRRAEEQLAEAETNLARVEDILGELRPQARRLAAQAEQQATRADAATELADAVVRLGRARWHEAAAAVSASGTDRERATRGADEALRALSAAESKVAAITTDLGARAVAEAERRERHEADRAALIALQLREARAAADLESIRRDIQRAESERAASESEVTAARRSLAVPVPPADLEAEAELAEAERALGEALAELGGLRASREAEGERAAAARRAEAVRHAELENARRRSAEAARRAAEEARALALAVEERAARQAAAEAARATLAEAAEAERAAILARESARMAAETEEAARAAAAERATRAGEALAVVQARVTALEARLAEDEGRGIGKAARRRGGRRIADDLQLEPRFRAAVEAALAEGVGAWLVAGAAVAELAGERGSLVVAERVAERGRTRAERDGAVLDQARRLGGGPLGEAVRRDATGAVGRLLERVAWVPDVEAALELQPSLGAGWTAVVLDGSAVVGPLRVSLGPPDGLLDRRAEVERLAAQREGLRAEDASLREALLEAEGRAAAAREALAAARVAETAAVGARRGAEDAERAAGRRLEAAVREAAWHEAQDARLAAEADRARQAVDRLQAATPARGGPPTGAPGAGEAVVAWERRAAEARERRDRIASALASRQAAMRAAEAATARAEAAVTIGEERLARAARDLEALGGSERRIAEELDALHAELVAAARREADSRGAVEELLTADREDRGRLAAAEADVVACRERSRAADERVRSAEVAELQARLALDAIREGLLVDLAAIGGPGLRRLGAEVGEGRIEAAVEDADDPAPARSQRSSDDDQALSSSDADETERLEALLAQAGDRWAAAGPESDPPSSARLGVLRRRFHELGAANPFAVEEYRALRERLETLEGQAHDLRAAIATTRRLIEELDGLIADQFRSTFRALESAFDRRFQQLFGGGFARLTLTEPGDLAATGVEIVARPPGKRAQPLAMLSGGERALTAVALLFAMLEVRPVPFCVLDEVDAALDEANVGRFTEALRELAAATQCIVITHNRGTIEAADALYGVTVGDDSVSRVISLRLEEAQDIAERARVSERLPTGTGIG